CTCADHTWPSWESSGGMMLDDVAPARYPDDRYRSVVLVWDTDAPNRATAEQSLNLARERRYLEPFRPSAAGDDDLGAWHPELLFEGSKRLDSVLDEGVELLDRSSGCRAELLDLLPPVPGDLVDEPVHWVYYPWRSTVVRLLGPRSHWRLRTDRNRYKLSDDELEQLLQRHVGVIGLSVGSAAAFALAQEGLCGRLRLADFDTLSLTNLNRLQGSVFDLTGLKTHALARRISELDPYLPVELFDEGVTLGNAEVFLAGIDLVVEECDSIDMKLLVRKYAAELGLPVVMETSDRGMLDVERFDLEPDREPFHGLVGDLNVAELADLKMDDKVQHVLAILESDELSAPMAASMIEIDATTRTWPQLASDIALGSSLIAETVRRLFVEPRRLASGRSRLDLDDVLDGIVDPTKPVRFELDKAPTSHADLPESFSDAAEQAARLAPSGGNMQPWRFHSTDESFEVEIAPASVVGLDIGLRGSAVACGAALANVMAVAAARNRLAAGEEHLRIELDLDRPTVAGSVRLGDSTDVGWAELAKFVSKRVSNRQLGPAEPLDPGNLSVLESATAARVTESAPRARLRYVPVGELDELVDVWSESDRVRYLTERLHGEMMSELRRPGIDDLSEGIDERTLELTRSDRAKLAVLRRWDVMDRLAQLDAGSRLGEDSTKRILGSSGLVAVTIEGSSRDAFIAGGVALQRMWLAATKLGLWLHPMSPIFTYAQTSGELEDVIDPRLATDLEKMRRTAYSSFGCGPAESFVLTARIHAGPAPTAISQRRSTADRVATRGLTELLREVG
ncbi:MAG: Rv1355c family protein, partial [Acidimicrobiales bacterium]